MKKSEISNGKENVNFKVIEHKGVKKTRLRARFEDKKYTVSRYAQILKINHSILSNILDGKYDGSKSKEGGATRKMIIELKKDGVWLGKFPWEIRNECKRIS